MSSQSTCGTCLLPVPAVTFLRGLEMIDRLFLATKEKHISLPPSSILPPQQLPIPNGGSHKRSSPSPYTHSPFDGIFIKEGEWEMAKRSFAAKSFIATTQFVGARGRAQTPPLCSELSSHFGKVPPPSLPPPSALVVAATSSPGSPGSTTGKRNSLFLSLRTRRSRTWLL